MRGKIIKHRIPLMRTKQYIFEETNGTSSTATIATFLREIYNSYKSTVFFFQNIDAYTGPSETSMLELFCENIRQYGPKYVSGTPVVSVVRPKKNVEAA